MSTFFIKTDMIFIEKLSMIISDYKRYEEIQSRLAQEMKSFLWEYVISRYDRALERLARF